jgi:glycosyltransferase involved in cell wall biosynthesis
MRIAIISPFQLRLKRGIERANWSLATEFARQGAATDLLVWDHPSRVSWGDIPEGVRVFAVPYVRYYMAHWTILFYLWWLRRQHYDWVIITFASYGEAAALRRTSSIRICILMQYPYPQVPHRYAEFKKSGLVDRCSCCIAVSKYTASGVEKFFGKPCHVIPNGVDVEAFKPSAELRASTRHKLGIPDEAPVIITAAALEERKGVQHVVRAVAALKAHLPTIRYLVLGEGPYRAELETLVAELDAAEQVHLIGSVNNVIPYFASADVGCLLSYGEAFPLTSVEYMAMGLPCIVSQHPPFDEIIEPEFGLVVDEQDSVALQEALYALLTNPERRQLMGQAGRLKAISTYSWQNIAAQYLKLFRSLH